MRTVAVGRLRVVVAANSFAWRLNRPRRLWPALAILPLLGGCPHGTTTASNGALKTVEGVAKTGYIPNTPMPTILAKDVSAAPLPAGPLGGTLHGGKFTPDSAQVQAGVSQMTSPNGSRVVSEITQYHLMLRQGANYPNIQDMTVHLNMKSGATLRGQSFAIKPVAAGTAEWRKQFQAALRNGGTPLGVVGVSINWRAPGAPQTQSNYFSEKFSLRLKFGQPQGGKLPGQIVMYLPDQEKSYVTGSFQVAAQPQDPEPAWDGPSARLMPADVSNAALPATPVTGLLHGQKFTIDKAQVISNGALVLSQGKGAVPERSLTIYFFLDDKKKLAGKTYQVKPQAPLGTTVPHITANWQAKDFNGAPVQKQDLFLTKYSMRAKFDKLQNNKIPAHLNLRLPDKQKSFVAGNFLVDVPQP